ncbi:MAG: DUF4760 domain-containing protein, partial [Pseudomonadota bacterium]
PDPPEYFAQDREQGAVVNWLDIAADVSTIAAALAVLVTTGFVWRQVALQRENRDTDAKRFARETLHVIHDHLQDTAFLDDRREFFDGAHKLSYEEMTRRDRESARRILNVYSLLARMIRLDIVDEAIVRDYWRASLISDWDRLENFVVGERLRRADGKLHELTERMVERWAATP